MQTIQSNEFACVEIVAFDINFIEAFSINNKPAMVQIMAWCVTDNKPLPNQCWPCLRRPMVLLGISELKLFEKIDYHTADITNVYL